MQMPTVHWHIRGLRFSDGQFPLLTPSSRDWNVDEPQYREAFGWKCRGWEWIYHGVAGDITLSDIFELGWIRNANGLQNL